MTDQDIIIILEAREQAQKALKGLITVEQKKRLSEVVKMIDDELLHGDYDTINKLLHVNTKKL